MKIQNVKKLERILQEFRKINPDMTVSMALTFVALAEGNVTAKNLEKRYGFSGASASRNLRIFDKMQTPQRKGWDLARQIDDPVDFRAKLRVLNTRGEHYASVIESILEE